jgi:hypothetical protein
MGRTRLDRQDTLDLASALELVLPLPLLSYLSKGDIAESDAKHDPLAFRVFQLFASLRASSARARHCLAPSMRCGIADSPRLVTEGNAG